jgi:hypothetical protein
VGLLHEGCPFNQRFGWCMVRGEHENVSTVMQGCHTTVAVATRACEALGVGQMTIGVFVVATLTVRHRAVHKRDLAVQQLCR